MLTTSAAEAGRPRMPPGRGKRLIRSSVAWAISSLPTVSSVSSCYALARSTPKRSRRAWRHRLASPVSGLLQALEMLDKMRGELLRQVQTGPAAAPESTHWFSTDRRPDRLSRRLIPLLTQVPP